MKKKVTIRIDDLTHTRAMRMVYWTPGISLSGIVDELLRNCVNHVEKERGGAFKDVPVKRIGRDNMHITDGLN